MNWYDLAVVAIAGLVLSLPLCLILELQARAIAFFIRSVRRSLWHERPWSLWKIMDWLAACRNATFLNNPPQLRRRESLIVRTTGVVLAYAAAWQLYFHLPH